MQNVIEIVNRITDNLSNKINDKIIGVNFLEKFKYILIDEINKSEINKIDLKNFGMLEDRKLNKNLLIKIENFSETTSKIKYLCSDDKLTIVLKGSKILKIISNSNEAESQTLNLFETNGIVISKNTSMSEIISKNSLILDIIYLNTNIEN